MLITENKYFLQNNDRHYKQQQKKKETKFKNPYLKIHIPN